jgi:hypothetical protein
LSTTTREQPDNSTVREGKTSNRKEARESLANGIRGKTNPKPKQQGEERERRRIAGGVG